MTKPSVKCRRRPMASSAGSVSRARWRMASSRSWGPWSKPGISWGPLISQLNGEAVQGLTLEQAVNKMKGPVNTRTRLKIFRNGAESPIEVSIQREIVRVRPVRYRTEGGDIGYVRITTFNEQTTDGLRKASAEISKQIPPAKIAGQVIHRRNNP